MRFPFKVHIERVPPEHPGDVLAAKARRQFEGTFRPNTRSRLKAQTAETVKATRTGISSGLRKLADRIG